MSARFDELSVRIGELRKLLLPAKFDPTGLYKDAMRVSTRAMSFRVLCHAEVEAYMEDRVLEISSTALKSWEKMRYVSTTAFHMIGFSGRTLDRPPETLHTEDQNKTKDWLSRVEIHDRFSRCVADYQRRVRKENHGIKEKNIMQMLVPIGFDMTKCDGIFLQAMSTFGEARGTVAHTSGKLHVQKGIDPKGEYSVLLGILKSLEIIDKEMDRLLLSACATELPAAN
ncbi:hypothetical protein [Glacieibacterium frigidum]|uniref:RiboL-PSP-HEPN domain-containing protein n=1 Tax=Glacieibacterium frigidum TaxID=2593303 RepID=A0A552UIP0_9SPHN|nr:hypothetical protein [Glacieibacterium frigidum]TRW18074.1 hypothetical protein FMM06_08175 [Glacieibacterium frigidum]